MSNTPVILWSQTKKNINLKICLSDSSNIHCKLVENNIEFNCESNNLNYNFSFQTLSEVKNDSMNVSGNSINISLEKVNHTWWDKLTENKDYKNHIKVDWDKWIDEEDEETVNNYDNTSFDMGSMEQMMQMMGGMGDNSCPAGQYSSCQDESCQSCTN